MPKVKDYQRFWSDCCPTEFTATRGADALQLAILERVATIRAHTGKKRAPVDVEALAPIPNYLGHRVDTFA